VLERIALHQTRLRTPGLGLDAKGVALGAKALVLLPSVDRLAAFLAVYTRERSLEDLLPTLALSVVRSKLGAREIVLEVAAESSDRLDRLGETARLVGGFLFTGTQRHFVQYRDANAPFGYDAGELASAEAAIIVYHARFSQAYDVERPLDLRHLLLRLVPRPDPTTPATLARVVVVEAGLVAPLVHWLVRSGVEGDVAMVEWPSEPGLDQAVVSRGLLRLPEVPPRLRGLLQRTPGITTFVPVAPGAAVEAGFRHPVELSACPVLEAAGLALLRGRGQEPWVVERLPVMGPLVALTRVELLPEGQGAACVALGVAPMDPVRVPVQVRPARAPWRAVTGAWIPSDKLPLLRQLAYALPPDVLKAVNIAVTTRGAFLRAPSGLEDVPLGVFYREAHAGLYVPCGAEVLPAVSPALVHASLGLDASHVAFLTLRGRAVVIDARAFVPMEVAVLEPAALDPAPARPIDAELVAAPIDLRVASVGAFPLQDADALPPGPWGR
jgi:hypothetical protein